MNSSHENLVPVKNSSQEDPTSYSMPEVLQDILLPLVGLLGILGNLVAGVILIRSNTKSTFHQSLKALIAADLLIVICMVVDSQKFEVNPENQIFIFLIPYFWNPFKNTVLTFQTFLIMSISAERYLAVQKPIHFNITKVKNSKIIHFLTFILPALHSHSSSTSQSSSRQNWSRLSNSTRMKTSLKKSTIMRSPAFG